jgi:hypothetical protein
MMVSEWATGVVGKRPEELYVIARMEGGRERRREGEKEGGRERKRWQRKTLPFRIPTSELEKPRTLREGPGLGLMSFFKKRHPSEPLR